MLAVQGGWVVGFLESSKACWDEQKSVRIGIMAKA